MYIVIFSTPRYQLIKLTIFYASTSVVDSTEMLTVLMPL